MKPRPGIKFTINIPLPTAVAEFFERCKYAVRKTKFKLHPYRCAVCNAAMAVKAPEYEYHVPDAKGGDGCRVMVHNFSWESVNLICRTCLVNELQTKEWTPRFTQMRKDKGQSSRPEYRFWSTKKCDVTGRSVRSYKDVEIYPYVDMTFCTIAWNHSYISKEVVIDCVKYGKIKTSHWGVWNKQRMAPMNDKGLFIDENGELL